MERKMYSEPVRASYRYETPNYDGTFRRWRAEVYIVAETEKSYYIKLIDPIPYRNAGELMRVSKRKVDVPKIVDTSGFWYNNLEKD